MYTIFPLIRSAEDWLQCSGAILASWSIFNPNGPTISCIGLRETGARDEREVFYRWLHFLDGEDYCLGYVNPRDDEFAEDLAEILQHGFALETGNGLNRYPLVTCVPTVVQLWLHEAWVPVFKDAFVGSRAIQQADWGRELYLLEKYGTKFFDRAAEEIREAYEADKADDANHSEAHRQMREFVYLKHQHIESFREWQPSRYQSRGLAHGDIETWWATVTSEDFCPVAASRLAEAWVGAIWQSDHEVKTSFEEVRDFFAHFSFPWWPETWTTESVQAGMGLAG